MDHPGPTEEDIEKRRLRKKIEEEIEQERLRKVAIEALRDRVTAAMREAKAIAAEAGDLDLPGSQALAGEIANYHYARIYNWMTAKVRTIEFNTKEKK